MQRSPAVGGPGFWTLTSRSGFERVAGRPAISDRLASTTSQARPEFQHDCREGASVDKLTKQAAEQKMRGKWLVHVEDVEAEQDKDDVDDEDRLKAGHGAASR